MKKNHLKTTLRDGVRRQKKATSFFAPEGDRLWFYKKNGEVGYVYDSPYAGKSKTHCGGLQNVGFDMSKSSKKARDLKGS